MENIMWDGTERRSMNRYCDGHQELREIAIRTEERIIAMDKRINGTVDDVKVHIENSRPRNIAIASILITVFIFLFTLAVNVGRTDKQVEVNTKILQSLMVLK